MTVGIAPHRINPPPTVRSRPVRPATATATATTTEGPDEVPNPNAAAQAQPWKSEGAPSE